MNNGWGCTDFTANAWDRVKVKYKKKNKERRKEEKGGRELTGWQSTS